MFKKHLKIIQIVHNNMSHIEDLELLGSMFDKMTANGFNISQEEIDKLSVVCKTTQNSHYDYGLYLNKKFQNPENHVDKLLPKEVDNQDFDTIDGDLD